MSRIMVVDDDPSIRELMTSLLESEGHQVEAFASPIDALRAARNRPPQVAIVDLMMPGMDGQDLVLALRHDPRTRFLPILMCSAYYGELRRTVLEFGRDNVAHLRKPFFIEDLLEMVARLESNTHDAVAGPEPSRTSRAPAA